MNFKRMPFEAHKVTNTYTSLAAALLIHFGQGWPNLYMHTYIQSVHVVFLVSRNLPHTSFYRVIQFGFVLT